MKRTLFILIVLILSLLYYLGLLTQEQTFPFSKEFFSTETSTSEDPAFDLKARWSAKGKEGDRRISFLSPSELDQLYQLKLDKGIRNIPLLSSFLIREAEKSRLAGNSDQAVEWTRYAVKFSPDLPGPYFALSRALWHKNPLEIHRILFEVWKGQGARLRYYPTALQLFYNAFYLLANALLMTFIVFGIVVLLKYLPLYFYDIRKNLSQEIAKLLINSLKIFLLFIPFFLRLDILWALLFYCVLLWGFVAKRERQWIVFFLIVLVYLPFFLRSASSFLDGASSDILLQMNEANYLDWDRATEQRLKNWLSTHPDDREVIFTLGLMGKRQSRYAQAEEYYRRAILVSPQFSDAFSNLGNVYFAKKQSDLAVASYQQAIALNPHRAAYYYNLYRAYSQETFLSGKSDQAFQKARQLDPKLVEYYTSIDTPPHMNRLVIDQVLTPRALWTRFLTHFIGREGILFRLFRAWFEKIPSRIPLLVPFFFLGFLAGMSKYSRAKRFLTRCPMCGSPTHRLYLGSSGQEYICFNCYRILIQKEKLHPKIAEKKSLQIAQFQKQNHFLGRFLSFFFVGFHDLWEERPSRGIFLLFLFFVFILKFFYWKGVISSSVAEFSLSLWNLIFWIGLFGLYYFLMIRQVFRLKARFETKKETTPGL
ncbi:MAG TPA: tetratricopeptide repeat protein [Thermodesulfobacteriota bacterium]|nr:tetratricopeptide repeat protein [Thermodesulfobacteriota bacterium]